MADESLKKKNYEKFVNELLTVVPLLSFSSFLSGPDLTNSRGNAFYAGYLFPPCNSVQNVFEFPNTSSMFISPYFLYLKTKTRLISELFNFSV